MTHRFTVQLAQAGPWVRASMTGSELNADWEFRNLDEAKTKILGGLATLCRVNVSEVDVEWHYKDDQSKPAETAPESGQDPRTAA